MRNEPLARDSSPAPQLPRLPELSARWPRSFGYYEAIAMSCEDPAPSGLHREDLQAVAAHVRPGVVLICQNREASYHEDHEACQPCLAALACRVP